MAKNSYKGLKISDFEKNRENPFVEQSVQEINQHTVKKWRSSSSTDRKAILTAVNEDGENLGYTRFLRQVEVDEDQFAKLFLSQFHAFFQLKPSAIKVFGYIIQQLKPNKDEFIFFMEDCLEYTKYKSERSINYGLADLLKSGIIARGRKDFIYYINPLVVFNGNRVAFATEYVKKKESDKNQLEMF